MVCRHHSTFPRLAALAVLTLAACSSSAINAPVSGDGLSTVATVGVNAIASVDVTVPVLPAIPFRYADADIALPFHFTALSGPNGSVAATDNTPASNRVTDAGATLGRVLFYDKRLSVNNQVACASCHAQARAFGDSARLSRGFAGGLTHRHAMALANARYYQPGRFFWDERASTLEVQVLMPIQDATEMGMTLPALQSKLAGAAFYAPLFRAAFGTADVTSDRISRALAQFVRSLSSYRAKFDQAFVGNARPNFAAVFTAQELQGQQLFVGRAGCARCHRTDAQVSNTVHNNGLDAVLSDTGAGGGRFKSPSLRNTAVRAPYMHDGRFTTLRQVVEHYNSGIQGSPNLDRVLRGPNGQPQRLNLTSAEMDALVAYLGTLTDASLLTDPKFSSPFPRP